MGIFLNRSTSQRAPAGRKGSPAKSILYTSREILHGIWNRDNAADARRTDVERGIQELGNGAKFLQPCAPSEPVHIRGSDDHFDLSTSFVYQSGRLQRTLAGANNCNSFPDETAHVSLIRDVGDEFRWQSFERLWPASKRPNSRGDHHPARLQLLAVAESYSEAVGIFSRSERFYGDRSPGQPCAETKARTQQIDRAESASEFERRAQLPNASIVSAVPGSEICDAAHGERRSIPSGMCAFQNSIGSPNTRTSRPWMARRCAPAASPYGPAPRITTSQTVIATSQYQPVVLEPR